MLRTGSWTGRGASGIAMTALVAASAAAARSIRTRNNLHGAPLRSIGSMRPELTRRESKSGQKFKEFGPKDRVAGSQIGVLFNK